MPDNPEQKSARARLYAQENISVITINSKYIADNPEQKEQCRKLLRVMHDTVFKKYFGSEHELVKFDDLCNCVLGDAPRDGAPPWANVNRSISMLAKNPMGVDLESKPAIPQVYAFVTGINCPDDSLGFIEYIAKDSDVRLPFEGIDFKVTSFEVRSAIERTMDNVAKELGQPEGIKGVVGESWRPDKISVEEITQEGDPWERFGIFKKIFGSKFKIVPATYSIPECTVEGLTDDGKNGIKSIDNYLLWVVNNDSKTIAKRDIVTHLVSFNKNYYGIGNPLGIDSLRKMFKELNDCNDDLTMSDSKNEVAYIAKDIKENNEDDLFKWTKRIQNQVKIPFLI